MQFSMSMAEFSEGKKPPVNGESLSQEDAIVGNPLVDLKTPERKLSDQEEAILWANQVFEVYNALPKITGNERKKAKNLIHETARQLMQNPKRIDTAASIWKSHEPSLHDSDSKERSFYELVGEELGQQARDHWKELSSGKLTELVKTYAHNRLVSDMAGEILVGYFRGPNGIQQRIDSLYDFVYGLMDLTSDTKALEEGLKIARFESNILLKGSSFHKDYEVAGVTLDDDELLAKTISINNAILGLSHLVSSYTDENINNFIRGSLETDSRTRNSMSRALRKFSKEELLRRSRLLGQLYAGISFGTSESINNKSWPLNLLAKEGDILRQRLNAEIAPLMLGYVISKRVQTEIKETGGKVNLLEIIDPEGYILNIFLPDGLSSEEKSRLIKVALKERHLSDDDRKHLERKDLLPMINTGFSDNGITIRAFYRNPGITEINKHSVSALETIGFPISGNDGQDLAEEIQKKQIRFLNRRGIRVPLEGQLKDLGYSHIDFHKDTDPDKILIKIFVGDVAYSVKLDKYFNLDLEGKRFDNLALSQSLRYVFLSLLRPILCEERIRDPHLPEVGAEEKEIVSRMGHLRWLPRGRRFTEKAVRNCFEHEGKDLFAVNFQRMQEHENDEKHKGMETTYVKPVVEKEENLPPITIHLPGVLQFN